MPHERPLVAMEAEQGVLGALMKKPELCEVVGAFLSPTDFSHADNSVIYSLILACHSKAIVPDPLLWRRLGRSFQVAPLRLHTPTIYGARL